MRRALARVRYRQGIRLARRPGRYPLHVSPALRYSRDKADSPLPPGAARLVRCFLGSRHLEVLTLRSQLLPFSSSSTTDSPSPAPRRARSTSARSVDNLSSTEREDRPTVAPLPPTEPDMPCSTPSTASLSATTPSTSSSTSPLVRRPSAPRAESEFSELIVFGRQISSWRTASALE